MVQIHSCQLGDFCDTYNYQPVFGSWVISGWLAILRNATERRRSLQQGSTGVKAKTSSYSYVKATLVNEDSKPKNYFFLKVIRHAPLAGWKNNLKHFLKVSLCLIKYTPIGLGPWMICLMSSEVLSARKASATAGAGVWFPGFVRQKWREGRAF